MLKFFFHCFAPTQIVCLTDNTTMDTLRTYTDNTYWHGIVCAQHNMILLRETARNCDKAFVRQKIIWAAP